MCLYFSMKVTALRSSDQLRDIVITQLSQIFFFPFEKISNYIVAHDKSNAIINHL